MCMGDGTKEHVVVIGGGGTGAATAYDLSQRGYRVTLFEQGELTCGSTGRHHGLLHSGARYAVNDSEVARECIREAHILVNIAPESIEPNRGVFIALSEEELSFRDEFMNACEIAGIENRFVDGDTLRRMEPNISAECLGGVVVPDGTLDAFRLPMYFFAGARELGAVIRNFTRVTGFRMSGGTITGVQVRDLRTGHDETVGCDFVINTAGAWAGVIAAMADIDLPITPAPGTMLAHKGRLVNMIIERLRPATDGDILVPQRNLSIIGATQWHGRGPDDCEVPDNDIDVLASAAAEMVPKFAELPYQKAWAAVRPLAGRADNEADGRELSREFAAQNHAESDGVQGMISVTGGKATTLRSMAEKTVDLFCSIAGDDTPCRSADTPLPDYRRFYTAFASGMRTA